MRAITNQRILSSLGRLIIINLLFLYADSTHAQVHLTGFIGGTNTIPSDVRLHGPGDQGITFQQIHWQTESLRSPIYFGLRIEYQLRPLPWLGGEVEFIHAKVIADPEQVVLINYYMGGAAIDERAELRTNAEKLSVSHGMNYLLFNLTARFGLFTGLDRNESPLDIVVRLGIGPTIPHPETSIHGRRRSDYQYGGLATQAAVGIAWWLSNRFALVAEYKFTRARLEFKTALESADTILKTHHIIGGICWKWHK